MQATGCGVFDMPVSGAADPRPLVAHVVYRFSMGGLENGVVNLINRMPHDRWRHTIVALTDIDAGFASRITRNDVSFTALHKPPGQGLWQFSRLHKLFRQLCPAIVHTRNLGALEAQLPAWAAGVPGRVHGEHGRDADDVDGTNWRHILMRKFYRRFVHEHISLGAQLYAYGRDRVGVSEIHHTAVYNGVDDKRFSPAPSRQAIPGCPFTDSKLWLLGTVGRMQTVKAQPLLARAFVNALHQQRALRERMRLVMVGDGPLREQCLSILAEAGAAELAWLPGARDDVPAIMRGLDCFVLPSLAEGISNTILEAMACGLPVIATSVGATPELVADGATGLVVPPGDIDALTAALSRMSYDRAAAAAMGHAGRQCVERRFTLDGMANDYQRIYFRVLSRIDRTAVTLN